MAKRTEHELSISIGGKVESSLSKSVQDINRKMDSIGTTMKAVAGIAATAFASIKLKDWFDETVEASKEFEVSMAGVAKVVDGLKDDNGKVTKSYYEMKDAIIELSKELPMTAENIAAIVEAAGQSNIESSQLIRFAEDATKMGIAFDSTAEQAGDWMAAWRTALNLDQNQVVTLADQINYLGNTTSENALKLSEVITRVGSLAGTAGISAASVAALAASMTKVGSEVSATGIKNFSLALVAGESATKKQSKAFKTLGLDVKNVAKSMQTDSQGTIINVLERINKLSKEKQTSVMKSMFGSESLAAIAPLVANLDNLKLQFEKVGDAAQYAGSMEQEYISASSTAANVDLLTSNKIKAMQIQIGDTLVPLSVLAAQTKGTLADMVSDFASDNAPAINRAVKNIKDGIEENIPNIVYGLKSFAKETGDFLYKFKPLAEYIKDNPSVVPNFIKSVGATMLTYKLGKNIGEIAKNLKQVGSPLKLLSGIITNPWALAIGAVAGGIALIATNVASARKELRMADLAARFGEITLSLSDLDKIASQMLYTDNFGKLSEAMKIKDGLGSLSSSVNEAIKEMNKLNWKVGIGLELTEDDIEVYKRSVTSFITDTQTLLDESQYALNLSLEVLTNDDEFGKSIRGNSDKFSAGISNELRRLGKELQEEVNKGFEDGLLVPDEIEVISNLQKQMSAIASKMAQSEFEASLEVIKMKAGTDLTPESYSNLIAELQEQKQSAVEDYDKSLQMNIAYAKVRLDEGAISPEQYEKEIAHYKDNYLKLVGELDLIISNFATDTLYHSYGSEINYATPIMNDAINSILDENKKFLQERLKSDNLGRYALSDFIDTSLINPIQKASTLSRAEKENLLAKYKELLPTKKELEVLIKSYTDENKDIPEKIWTEFSEILTTGALAGDEDSILTLIGLKMREDEEYKKIIAQSGDLGLAIPEALLTSLESKFPKLELETAKVLNTIKQVLETGIEATIPFNLNIKTQNNPLSTVTSYKKKLGSTHEYLLDNLIGHKDGGIFDTPHIAWFAEDGPEAAIPLDGSSEAINLWHMAGQILGIFDKEKQYKNKDFSFSDAYTQLGRTTSTNVGNSPVINFINNITVENGADAEKVQNAVSISQEEFNRKMKIYEREMGRVSMAGG